jgi:hypothetical protein
MKCAGDDCVEARNYDKELDYMQDVLHYDRVPEDRSDTELKKFSRCSFRVNVSDRDTGDIKTVELRGVFLDDHVVTSAKGTAPSEFECEDRALFRYKDDETVWRFPVHKKTKVLHQRTKVLGVAFGIECEDCMKLSSPDYVFDPLLVGNDV